ncbi:MAG: carboxypeptidase regulatory-like domain-containing protein [Candidatus Hydrogenedentales bacterium]|jgi:hypothetical protein
MRTRILATLLVVLGLTAVFVNWYRSTMSTNSRRLPPAAEMVADTTPEARPAPETAVPPISFPKEAPPPPPEPPEPAIPAAVTVSGIVVRASDEAPIAGAEVRVRLPIDDTGELNSLNIEPWAQSCTADEDGEFSIEIPAPGLKYVFGAGAPGFQPAGARKLIPEEGLAGLKLCLYTLCSVSGRVLDAQGEPVQNVVVGAAHGFHASPEHESTYTPQVFSDPTGPDGAFSIHGLKSGYCALVPKGVNATMDVLGATLEEGPFIIELAKEEHRGGVQLKLNDESAQYIIEGIVQDSRGRRVAGATVWSGLLGGPQRTTATRPTDEQGRFRLDCVSTRVIGADGKFATSPVELFCKAEGYEPAHAPNVPMGSKDVVLSLVDWCRGRITGNVRVSGSRRAVIGAQVAVWQVYTDWGDRTRMDYKEQGVKTDEQGRFELPDVPAGEVTLQVIHPEFGVSLHRDGVTVRPGRATEAQIVLQAPGVLEVEAMPVSPAQELENLWCALEVFPESVLTTKDAYPWDYTYCANEYNVPVSYALENAAEMLVGAAATRLVGKDGWHRSEDGQWKGRLVLAPGDYTIKLRYHLKTVSENFAFKRVSVTSGSTTRVRFEIAGSAAIRIAVASHEARALSAFLLLTPSRDADVLPESTPGSRGYLVASLMQQSSFAAFAQVLEAGEYTFPALEPGQYRLTVYASVPETGGMHRRKQETVTINEGEEFSLQVAL